MVSETDSLLDAMTICTYEQISAMLFMNQIANPSRLRRRIDRIRVALQCVSEDKAPTVQHPVETVLLTAL